MNHDEYVKYTLSVLPVISICKIITHLSNDDVYNLFEAFPYLKKLLEGNEIVYTIYDISIVFNNTTSNIKPFRINNVYREFELLTIKYYQYQNYSNLTHLTFSDNFDREIGVNVLPSSLTHLVFGKSFNSNISQWNHDGKLVSILPPNLTYLKFGECFNKFIQPNTLPDSLTYLYFGKNYANGAYLHVGMLNFVRLIRPDFIMPIDLTFNIPKSLETLVIEENSFRQIKIHGRNRIHGKKLKIVTVDNATDKVIDKVISESNIPDQFLY